MASDVVKFVLQMQDNASAPLKSAGKAATQAGKKAKLSSTKWTELASKIALIKDAAGAARTGFNLIGKPLIGFAREVVAAGALMEGFETRLTVLMKSSSDAKKRLEKLFEIGSTTPFELPGLVEADINLRALGADAEKMLPLVMDFAGAMKIDVASAAVEMGRAMQFGAGAVETIAGRTLRTQVELRTGQNALKMSTLEFREAMVATLTDENGIFAGGTKKLALTFDGMVSNLRDSWFKFTKDVADAGVFAVSKEILSSILVILGEASDQSLRWAKILSEGIIQSMLFMLDTFGRVMITANFFEKSFLTAGVFVDQIGIKLNNVGRTFRRLILDADSFVNILSNQSRADMEKGILSTYKSSGEARERITKAMFDQLPILEQEENKLMKIRSEAERIGANLEGIIAGGKSGDGAAAPASAAAAVAGEPVKEDPEAKKARELLTGQLTELNDISMISAAWLEEMTSIQRQSSAELPVKMASASVGMLADPISSLTGMLGPAGGLIEGIASLGQMGAEKITEMLGGFIDAFIIGLVEVIPDLLVAIPEMLIEKLPEILGGILEAIPKILQAVLVKLPVAIARGAWVALKRIWAAVKKFFSDLWDSITPWQTGGVVQQTGLAYLHQGERIIPTSGASTQAVMAGASNIGAGQAINISTNVVDPNAIDGLARMLQRELGNFGGGRSLDIFNTPSAAVG